MDSFEILRAKYSLFTACLSPEVAADKWKCVKMAKNCEDEEMLIHSGLETAGIVKFHMKNSTNISYFMLTGKEIKQAIVEIVNLLCTGVQVGKFIGCFSIIAIHSFYLQ